MVLLMCEQVRGELHLLFCILLYCRQESDFSTKLSGSLVAQALN